MFGANVWRRVLGVDRATVIEDVDFDEESDTVVVHVRPRARPSAAAGAAGCVRRAMTRAKGDATGGRSTSAPCAASSRPIPRG